MRATELGRANQLINQPGQGTASAEDELANTGARLAEGVHPLIAPDGATTSANAAPVSGEFTSPASTSNALHGELASCVAVPQRIASYDVASAATEASRGDGYSIDPYNAVATAINSTPEGRLMNSYDYNPSRDSDGSHEPNIFDKAVERVSMEIWVMRGGGRGLTTGQRYSRAHKLVAALKPAYDIAVERAVLQATKSMTVSELAALTSDAPDLGIMAVTRKNPASDAVAARYVKQVRKLDRKWAWGRITGLEFRAAVKELVKSLLSARETLST